MLSLSSHFVALSEILHRYESLWKPTPFWFRDIPWLHQFPALAQRMQELTPKQLDACDDNPTIAVEWLGSTFPDVRQLHQHSQIAPFPCEFSQHIHAQPKIYGASPQKAAQIQAFAACLGACNRPFVEWCSGKGHLARYLTVLFQQPALCLEQQEQLCGVGQEQADIEHLSVAYEAVDVMEPRVSAYLEPEHHVVSLHACGQLHRRLLTLGILHRVHRLSVAPCCYHLGESDTYRPYSQIAQAQPLRLSSNDLRLATREIITRRTSRIVQRIQNQTWRMGFDLLQRDLRGVDEYLPAPSVPRSLLRQNFAAYCNYLANAKGLTLPMNVSYDHYETLGAERYCQSIVFETVRSLFRRPLEVWLVLDRALFLQEAGYDVSVGTFCQRQDTPRNLMIQARRTT